MQEGVCMRQAAPTHGRAAWMEYVPTGGVCTFGFESSRLPNEK